MNIKQSMVRLNTRFYWFLAILVFLTSLLTAYYHRTHRLTKAPALSADQVRTFYLNESTDLECLSKKLDSLGLLRDQAEFKWAGRLLGWNQFRMGRYELNSGISYQDLFIKLGRGYQDAQNVTILPGQSPGRFFKEISEQFAFDSTAIAKVFADSVYLSKDSLSRQQLFGRMLPETYQFYWTESPRQVVDKVRKVFQDKVVDEYEKRIQSIDFTVSEIVTLASIIEWEARKSKEKPIISGLYWNRLERGMRLQADPTVLYAIGERRRLYYKDYKIEHPYNTYIHRGLPPGPITNPSLSSIKAALYPSEHDYLFMVATPEGSHVFSETYDQHKRKSREWRKWIQEQYRLKRLKNRKKN